MTAAAPFRSRRLVTGNASSAVLSMVLATVLTAAFVLWSGIRGVANTAYLKDVFMIIALVGGC